LRSEQDARERQEPTRASGQPLVRLVEPFAERQGNLPTSRRRRLGGRRRWWKGGQCKPNSLPAAALKKPRKRTAYAEFAARRPRRSAVHFRQNLYLGKDVETTIDGGPKKKMRSCLSNESLPLVGGLMFSQVLLSRRKILAALLGLVLVLGPASVGTADAPGCNCVDLSGVWNCGYWKSFCSTHHGKLRARFVKCDACHYQVTFSGTFFMIIPFRYTVTMNVTGYGNGVVYLSASRNLPMFGGSFTMCGSASQCRFQANYTSKKDRGVFVLSR
jgi:hypothetical protein